MKVKTIKTEWYQDYKYPNMLIAFPKCNWKCEKDCGEKMCQNKELALSPDIEISYQEIVDRYMQNSITKAVIMAGLEPFDNWEDLVNLIHEFRKHTQDFIIIYSGFYLFEINDKVEYLRQNYDNIIIKFGRFVPNQEPHYDEVLGVNLASPNQYSERIS